MTKRNRSQSIHLAPPIPAMKIIRRFLAVRLATLALLLAALFPAPRAAAVGGVGDIVFDPSALQQAITTFKTLRENLSVVTDTLKEVRQTVEMGKEMLRIVGNPVLLLQELGLSDLTAIFREVQELANFGRLTMAQVAGLADSVKSLTDPRLNLFSNGRGLSLLVNGAPRDTGRYRGFAVFETQLSESNKVLDGIKGKMADLAKRKSELPAKLKDAKTENDRENLRAGLEVVRSAEGSYAAQMHAANGAVASAAAGLRHARAKARELAEEEDEILATQASQAARQANERSRRALWGR